MTMHSKQRLPRILLCLFGLAIPVSAQAVKPKKLPRKLRYVDAARTERAAELRALSTADLSGTIRYRCRFVLEKDQIEIQWQGRVERAGRLLFAIPVWNPGSYQIRNYGKFARDFRASQGHLTDRGNGRIELEGVKAGPLSLSYTMPATRFAQRSFRRRSRGATKTGAKAPLASTYQLSGPRIWTHEVRHVALPIVAEFLVPENWDLATGLRPMEGTAFGRVAPGKWRFEAEDYDVFADCPIKLGHFESFGFRVGNAKFEVALAGASPGQGKRQDFLGRVKRISAHFLEMFGGAPFDRYVYLFTVPGGGGLEHLNSTEIGLMSLTGSKPGRPVVWDTVIAHEFFHLWNVKRLRPLALGPFDYTGPNRTTFLWFAEGITSYYGNLAMPRTGLWSANDYWRHIARRYTALRNSPIRRKLSVADSSWRVWDGAYFGARDRIDYYLKGECLGLLLDIEIRARSSNRHSLDDLMRSLYESCEENGRGFGEDDVERVASKLAGNSLRSWFDAYVYGIKDLPVQQTLQRAGLLVKVTGSKRKRFRIEEDDHASKLGVSIRRALVDEWRKR